MSLPHNNEEKHLSSLRSIANVDLGDGGKDRTYCVKSLASFSRNGICSEAISVVSAFISAVDRHTSSR